MSRFSRWSALTIMALCAGTGIALAQSLAPPAVAVTGFGKTAEGAEAHLYTLTNAHGMVVRFTDWGGLVTEIGVPDRDGRVANVALGFGDVATYQAKNRGYFFGMPVGRFANRIGGARFSIEGRTVQLQPNDGPNILHSGATPGYGERFWKVTPFRRAGESGAVLRLVSPDGDQGFPGKLSIEMTYRLTDRNEFRIDYRATSDAPTVINLTNHSYFNLAGAGAGDVLGQTVEILADRVAEFGERKIPTGRLLPVSGGLDLRRPTVIGEGMKDPAIAAGGGYDHAFVLSDVPRSRPALVARAADPGSGRVMEVLTTEPSLQFYTGNGISGTDRGPDGRPFLRHGGFALETQHLPDSPNHPEFPSTELRPGQIYTSTTIYRFPQPGPATPAS